MRPINLIPPESRRGASAPMRTGPLPYLVLGALALVLAGVALYVLTGNTVSEREADVSRLGREDARAAAKAERLAAFTQFSQMQQARTETIASLADSRFDWERVMRELALILPKDAWLVNLSASASPEVGGEEAGGSGAGLRAGAPGPALELQGCAAGQEAVAGFVTALKDIDGVTRVGVESSELGDPENSASGGSEEGANEDCRTRSFIAQFSIVVAFDGAPVPPSAEEAPVAVAPPAEGEDEGEEEG
jgi:Tfp pilus assembly protein PilN